MNKLLESVLQQAMRTNPKSMQMLAELNRSGMTPQEFFYAKAKEMNVDPQSILDKIPPEFR